MAVSTSHEDDELTHDHPGDSQPSIQTRYQLSSSFTFPALGLDGSTFAVRSKQITPPAALSSLGLRMASHSTSDSISSLDDAYDMVDDISESSSDDHETVSIASTTNHDREDEEPEHDIENETDVQVPADMLPQLVSNSDAVSDSETPSLSHDQAFKVRLPFHNGLASDSANDVHVLDSTVDELETPKQSMFTAKAISSGAQSRAEVCKGTAAKDQDKKVVSTWKSVLDAVHQNEIAKAGARMTSVFTGAIVCSILSCIGWMCLTYCLSGTLQPNNSVERAMDLHTSLRQFTGSDAFAKHINCTHLLPNATVMGKNIFGSPLFGTKDIRYQALAPNHLLVSLPQVRIAEYPTPFTLSVQRGLESIQANRTELIKGVHVVSIENSDAHGVLSVSMACKHPELAVSIAHDFGSRLLLLNTYEKACTDISKAFVKDVTVARDAAKAVSHNLHDDLEARLRVASSRLHSKSRELAIFVDKAAKTIRDAEEVSKGFVDVVSKDLVATGKDLQTAFSSALDTVKSLVPAAAAAIKEPIILSRERALTITERLKKLSDFYFPRTASKVKADAMRAKIEQLKADVRAAHHRPRELSGKACGQKSLSSTCKNSKLKFRAK